MDPNKPGGIRYIYIPRTQAGVRVDHDSALKLSTVFACVRIISESLCTLPWNVMERTGENTKQIRHDDPVQWLLNTQLNPEMNAVNGWGDMIAHALSWGNAYAEIERDYSGRPLWLWPIAPDRVDIERDAQGRLCYEVYNLGAKANTKLMPEDVFHLKGLGFDGVAGYSVIQMAAQAIGLGLACEQFGATFFGNNGIPGGVLEYPRVLRGDKVRANLRESWQNIHGGPGKAHTVAILEDGVTWKQISVPNEDSQFLETRKFQTGDIARWFRVPLHKLADLEHATLNNIEQLSIEFVLDCLLPWAVRMEQEANVKLFGFKNRGRVYTKHDFNGQLRADVKTRGEWYKMMTAIGAFSVNDVLEREDCNPIGSVGDKRLVQINLTTLEKIGQDPPKPEPPKPPPVLPRADKTDAEEPSKEAENSARPVAGSFATFFAEAIGRGLGREANMGAKAAKKHAGDPDGFGAWLCQWEPGQRKFLTEELQTKFLALAEAWGADSNRRAVETLLGLVVDGEIEQARGRLLKSFHEGFDGYESWRRELPPAIAGRLVEDVALAATFRSRAAA